MSDRDYEVEARLWFKDHVAACLVHQGDTEVWRFKKPNSGDCAFDIMITSYGMAMVGDYGSLVFNVGSSYGINFLRNRSKGYVVEKLEQSSKEYELDEEAFHKYVFEETKTHLEDTYPEAHNLLFVLSECTDFASLKNNLEIYSMEEEDGIDIYKYTSFLEEVEYNENSIDSAYGLMYDQDWMSDVFEANISKLTSFVKSRIWALHVAAEQILIIKEENDRKE